MSPRRARTAIFMALCWICKAAEATTAEHRSKRSDLKAVFGDGGPLYLHNDQRRNRKVQSINSKLLKFSASLCNACNSARTQPHDRAWETLSEALRTRKPRIRAGDIIRADRIFRSNTSQQMLNVHLFFAKALGCEIVENGITVTPAIDTIAHAIMQGKPHPNLWLAFSAAKRGGWVGATHLDAARLAPAAEGGYDYLCRIYHVDALEIRVRYSSVQLKPDWHPSHTNRFRIVAQSQWL
jgi:hypothetical protein